MNVFTTVVAAIGIASPLAAQWINYPTPGIPRTPEGKPNLTAPAPKTADGKPDLSGIWDMEHESQPTQLAGQYTGAPEMGNMGSSIKEGLPYTLWAAELMRARVTENRVNDPLSSCLPLSVPRLHAFNAPKRIVQSPSILLLAYEYNAMYRQIMLDGRALPVDPNPSWLGYSTGKWEGDTLVVQTTGFRDGLWLDNSGNPLTDSGKITERFHRVNFGQLEIDVTVVDPKAYTKPWTVKLKQRIVPDTELLEYICLENEKSVGHMEKK